MKASNMWVQKYNRRYLEGFMLGFEACMKQNYIGEYSLVDLEEDKAALEKAKADLQKPKAGNKQT